MPKQPIHYLDFSGGINESNDPERIGITEFETALDVDLSLGNIERRRGWKPIHDRIPPFFPSTRNAHIIVPATFGRLVTTNTWALEFLCQIERKNDDGEKYAVVSKEQFGTNLEGFLLYLYWIDDDVTSDGGFYLGYSSSAQSSPDRFDFPAGGWPTGTQVLDPSEVPDVGVPFMVSIRKVTNGADRDIEFYVDDVLKATISTVGTDNLDDQIMPMRGGWQFGWSQLDWTLTSSGAGGTSGSLTLSKVAPLTFGEIRLFDTDTPPSGFTRNELPPSQRTDLKYHIPMSSPQDGFFPGTDLGETDTETLPAYSAAGRPIITSELDGFFPAGLLFQGFGNRATIVADSAWSSSSSNGLQAGADVESFFSVSGIAWQPCTLLQLPIGVAGTVGSPVFSLILMWGGGVDFNDNQKLVPKVVHNTVPGGINVVIEEDTSVTAGPTVEVEPGVAFTLTFRISGANNDNTASFTLTQGGSTITTTNLTGTFNIGANVPGDQFEPRAYFRIGGETDYGDRFAFSATTNKSGVGEEWQNDGVYIDRVLIRLDSTLPGYDNASKDDVLIRPDENFWDQMDFILQIPEKWAKSQQAPFSLPVQKGVFPDRAFGESEVRLDLTQKRMIEWTGGTDDQYLAPVTIKTTCIEEFIPLNPISILWAGAFRLRSQARAEDSSIIIVPGGILSVNDDETLTCVGSDLVINKDALPDVVPANGRLSIQGKGNSDLFLFDGFQVFRAVQPQPRIATELLGAGSLTGKVTYKVVFFNAKTGSESIIDTIELHDGAADGTALDQPSSEQVRLTWNSEEADEGVSTVRIYRTNVGDELGSLFLIGEENLKIATFTDNQSTIDISDLELVFDSPSTGGMSLAYLNGRHIWSDPTFPELMLISPTNRQDRIEQTLFSPAAVNSQLTTKNALLMWSDAGMHILSGNSVQNFRLDDVHRFATPSSGEGGTPHAEHPNNFFLYYTTRGIEQESLDARRLISQSVEDTMDGLDLTKIHKFDIGIDPKLLRTYFAVVSNGESKPDKVLVWAISRNTQRPLWYIYRLPAEFIGEVIQNNLSKTVFAVGGYLSTLDNPFDGWDGTSSGTDNLLEVDGSSSTTTELVITSGSMVLADNELNGRMLTRATTGEVVQVGYNIGQTVYLLDTLSSSPATSNDEDFNIGVVLGEFTLREEVPMEGPRYWEAKEVQVRGEGGNITISCDMDGKTQTGSLDVSTQPDVTMWVGESGRVAQISGTLIDDGTKIETIEFWVDPLELRR